MTTNAWVLTTSYLASSSTLNPPSMPMAIFVGSASGIAESGLRVRVQRWWRYSAAPVRRWSSARWSSPTPWWVVRLTYSPPGERGVSKLYTHSSWGDRSRTKGGTVVSRARSGVREGEARWRRRGDDEIWGGIVGAASAPCTPCRTPRGSLHSTSPRVRLRGRIRPSRERGVVERYGARRDERLTRPTSNLARRGKPTPLAR